MPSIHSKSGQGIGGIILLLLGFSLVFCFNFLEIGIAEFSTEGSIIGIFGFSLLGISIGLGTGLLTERPITRIVVVAILAFFYTILLLTRFPVSIVLNEIPLLSLLMDNMNWYLSWLSFIVSTAAGFGFTMSTTIKR